MVNSENWRLYIEESRRLFENFSGEIGKLLVYSLYIRYLCFIVYLFLALFVHNTCYSTQYFHRDLMNGSATREPIEAKAGL